MPKLNQGQIDLRRRIQTLMSSSRRGENVHFADQAVAIVHDPDFRASEKDFKSFIEVLSEKLTEIDDTIPELPIKDIVSF